MSSARSNLDESSPGGWKSGSSTSAECLAIFGLASPDESRRRPKSHQATKPVTRATTGNTVPIAILALLLRPPLSVLLLESRAGEAAGVELVGEAAGVELVVELVPAIGKLEADTVVDV